MWHCLRDLASTGRNRWGNATLLCRGGLVVAGCSGGRGGRGLGAVLAKQVPEDVKDARLAALQALLTKQMQAFNAGAVGRTLDVLFTGPGRHPGQIVGRSPYLQAVNVYADAAKVGTIEAVTITRVGTNSLHGAFGSGELGSTVGASAA